MDISRQWDLTAHRLWRLASLTEHKSFRGSSMLCLYQDLIPFYGQIIFHCVARPRLAYPSVRLWSPGCFHSLAAMTAAETTWCHSAAPRVRVQGGCRLSLMAVGDGSTRARSLVPGPLLPESPSFLVGCGGSCLPARSAWSRRPRPGLSLGGGEGGVPAPPPSWGSLVGSVARVRPGS